MPLSSCQKKKLLPVQFLVKFVMLPIIDKPVYSCHVCTINNKICAGENTSRDISEEKQELQIHGRF